MWRRPAQRSFSGLIATAERIEKLQAYLEKTPPNSGPALPAADARFNIEHTAALPSTVVAALENNLNDFIAYLDKVGFPTDTERVKIRVEKLRAPNAEYHSDEKVIMIDRGLIDDPYLAC